jgi:hypothetical protein
MKMDQEFVIGIIIVSIIIFLFIGFWVLLFKYIFIPLINQSFEAKKCRKFSSGDSFKAGGRFDMNNYSFPLVNIKLDDLFIEINNIDYNIILNYEQIISVEHYKGNVELIWNGVYIKHNKKDIPEEIIIRTPYYNQLINYINTKKQL